MSQLSEAIQEMRNMREAYDQLSGAAAVYNEGKPQIASAISAKGVSAGDEDSLQTLAQKISQIPQQINTRTSDFEQMIAPTPYMWNVYSIASDLMKETLPNYLPAYMQDYKSRYGTNAFFVGEYYLGYASLELTGADGYLTNDGDFYTIAGEEGSRVVTHTLPNGTVETYSAESIVHQWHDNDTYCNRWVAFFYLSDGYSFTNVNSSICPRRVALCGNCGSFIVSGENRLTDVWVIGTLGHLEGGTTGSTWNPAQVIKNYHNHSGNAVFVNPTNVVSIIMPDLESMATHVFSVNDNRNCALQVLCLPKQKTTIKHSLGYTNLKYLLSADEGSYIENNSHGFSYCYLPNSGTVVEFPNLVEVGNTGNDYIGLIQGNIKEILVPKLETLKSYWYNREGIMLRNPFGDILDIEIIYAPSLSFGNIFLSTSYSAPKLKDVWVGEMYRSLNLSAWTATDITISTSGIAEINSNIRNHIAARIKDMTGETSPTITFGANLFNNLEQATIDAFEDKNWIVASA